jgi:hypothetical protein
LTHAALRTEAALWKRPNTTAANATAANATAPGASASRAAAQRRAARIERSTTTRAAQRPAAQHALTLERTAFAHQHLPALLDPASRLRRECALQLFLLPRPQVLQFLTLLFAKLSNRLALLFGHHLIGTRRRFAPPPSLRLHRRCHAREHDRREHHSTRLHVLTSSDGETPSRSWRSYVGRRPWGGVKTGV